MFEGRYHTVRGPFLVEGSHRDFEDLANQVKELFSGGDKGKTVQVSVRGIGEKPVTGMIFQKGSGANRATFEPNTLTFSIAPGLLEHFLSFLKMTGHEHEGHPDTQPHTHFERMGNDENIATDSLAVIFALKQ